MKIKIILAIVIMGVIFFAINQSYGRPKPEVKLPIEEVEVLKYEPIDFKEVLTKTEFASVSTERDPFKSPFLSTNKYIGSAAEDSGIEDG